MFIDCVIILKEINKFDKYNVRLLLLAYIKC
jgi:hypothetical protein